MVIEGVRWGTAVSNQGLVRAHMNLESGPSLTVGSYVSVITYVALIDFPTSQRVGKWSPVLSAKA